LRISDFGLRISVSESAIRNPQSEINLEAVRMSRSDKSTDNGRWYSGITRYQWLVLVIASLGWVFDAFEGQIFVSSMSETMPSLVPPGTPPGRLALFNSLVFGAFLLGGALGGIVFGILSDRIGRKRTLSWTILFYSVFTCLTAFSQAWWHLAAFRFLVALGVGGEWAVASALVAEMFPAKARAHVASIFHASSVIGVYLAIAAATLLIGNPAVADWANGLDQPWIRSFFDPATLPWRIGFALGLLPALLTIWIRRSLREPESWQAARSRSVANPTERMGAIVELFQGGRLRRTCIGLTLAAVGLATYWGAHIYGKDILRDAASLHVFNGEPGNPAALKRWEMLGMFLVTTGGGLGLVAFGPIAQQIGRRGAFAAFQFGGLVSAIIVFQFLESIRALVVALPIYGFLTLGMHAGFAVYFPELYPTRLRGTGTGFCFNAGRVLAAPTLIATGWLQDRFEYDLRDAATLLSLLFVAGILVLPFAPETRGQELSE
jgi:MFS family permease